MFSTCGNFFRSYGNETPPNLLVNKLYLSGFAFRKLSESHWNILVKIFFRICVSASIFESQAYGVVSSISLKNGYTCKYWIVSAWNWSPRYTTRDIT